jgi:dCMP deaminase
MLGATLYMCCTDPSDGHVIGGTCSCMMCKKLVINAGIDRVIVRDTDKEFTEYIASSWVEDDDSLTGKFGY